MSTFLPAMWAAFFIRVRPASRNANPACMNMTRTAASTTQTVLTAMTRSAVFTRLLLERRDLKSRRRAEPGFARAQPTSLRDLERCEGGGQRGNHGFPRFVPPRRAE